MKINKQELREFGMPMFVMIIVFPAVQFAVWTYTDAPRDATVSPAFVPGVWLCVLWYAVRVVQNILKKIREESL